MQKISADAKRKSMAIMETTLAEQLKLEGVADAQAEDVVVALQPLLEQEAQLECVISLRQLPLCPSPQLRRRGPFPTGRTCYRSAIRCWPSLRGFR